MYIWVAIDVNEQMPGLREIAEHYVKGLGMSSPTLTLPFHISLKISFNIPNDRINEVVGDIIELCRSLTRFSISVKEIEQNGSIVWITMQENDELSYIHNKLDEMLLKKHGVVQHIFDKAFIYHMSLLIMDDENQARQAFDTLKNISIPKTLIANKIIIGSSIDGAPGTYSVNEEIDI